jgi:hypothetical protein
MQEPLSVNRVNILNSLQQRNTKEKDQFFKLIKSRNQSIYIFSNYQN